MVEAINDEIRIEIDNLVWTAFESITVTKSMQNLCGQFTFRTVKEGALIPFANGAQVRILIGTPRTGFETVLNGYIEEMLPEHDDKRHFIIVSGRDKTEDVLDSTIGGNITFNAPISLVSLTQKVLKNLGITGINVSIDVKVPDLTEADLQFTGGEVFSSLTGESVFNFLSRYARKKQVLLTTDQNGDLLFTRTSNNVIKTRLIYKNVTAKQSNILSGRGAFNNSKRFNRYNCYSQFNPTALRDDSKAIPATTETKTIGSATDDGIRSSRVFNFIGDSPFSDAAVLRTQGWSQKRSDDNDSTNRAIWESNVRRAKSFYYIAKILGYRAYEDGIIWRPNLLVHVDDEDVQINSQLLINKVTYSKDLSGSTTLLEFVSKDTFDLLEITGKHARKKASERVEGRKFAGKT